MEVRTRGELEKKIAALEEQMAVFTMNLQYELLLIKFRETFDAWYEERITLGDSLDAMMANMKLCGDIGVWRV